MPLENWDARWRDKTDQPFQPDPWLLQVLHLLPLGEALDVACGRGRNALFLAERGWSVTAVDFSAIALDQLRAEAKVRQCAIELLQLDLETNPVLPETKFDLILDFFYLQRALLPRLQSAIRPGGVIVLRTFSRAGNFPGGPKIDDFVLEPGELLHLFTGWEILRHEEGLEPSSKGGSLAGIVARRPPVTPCV